MRRRKQELSQDEILQILEKGTSGVLALIGDNGYPYAVPLSYVYSDNTFYFHSAKEGHKIDSIRNSCHASFCVVDKDDVHPQEYTTYYRSVISFGRITIIEDYDEKYTSARVFAKKYNKNDEKLLKKEMEKSFDHMLMLRFDIDHMTGKEAIELVRERKK